MQETRQETTEKYEAERMTLVVANQELEKKLAKYKAQIRELKSKQQPQAQQEDGSDGLFDVLTWKQHASTPEPVEEKDENLEDSMKKVGVQRNSRSRTASSPALWCSTALRDAKVSGEANQPAFGISNYVPP